MTLSEIKASKEMFLTADDIAPVLGCDSQTIRMEASRDCPRLGFPVIRMGTITKIPRKPFLEFIGEAKA